MAVDLLPFRIGQRAPAGQILASQGLQKVGILLHQMLDVQPVDVHDALQHLRRVHPGAVGQEWVRPHAWAAYVDSIQSIDLSPLYLEIETPTTFPLDSNRCQVVVIRCTLLVGSDNLNLTQI